MGIELTIEPPVCHLTIAGGTSKHKLVNNCDRKLAFRVKSSPNSMYKVSRAYGTIQIGYGEELEIIRQKGKIQSDKMIIEYVSVEQDCNDARFPFANGKPQGEVVGETPIKLVATE